MEYEKIEDFKHPENTSRGTFSDAFDNDKYETIEEAYKENDFVQVDYVRDSNGVLYYKAFHTKQPDKFRYRKLEIQRPIRGPDLIDLKHLDEIVDELFEINK